MSRSVKSDVETTLAAIEEREKAYGDALTKDAEAEHQYKVEKAKAFLAAEGTEKARESASIIAVDKWMLEHLKKKAVKEFTREALRDAQDALSARQSLLSYEAKTNFGYANNSI